LEKEKQQIWKTRESAVTSAENLSLEQVEAFSIAGVFV
jgi:hypothetical protein